MHIILGGTGHVGSVAAETLLAVGEPVTLVGRDASVVAAFRDDRPGLKGAEVAGVDVHDVEALRALFRTGRRAFLLNPPADPSTDTDAEETATVAAILKAIEGSGLEKVVAESTMGAVAAEALQPRTGDSSVLYAFEQGLAAQPIPAAINRAAYYFSNFDLQIGEVRKTGVLQTMYPTGFALPMVAPADLGRVAASRLMSGLEDVGVISIEGPTRPTFDDVAAAFARALNREVRTEVTAREQWIETFRAQGFSAPAADAYARMTAMALDGPMTPESETERGRTTLDAYIQALVDGG